MAAIKYTIVPVDPAAHLFEVECQIPNPDPNGQQLAVPAWIPGSYMIRDFAKHVLWVKAESDGKPVGIDKVDKDTWQCEAISQLLQIRYQVYAWDLSVRAAHLDQTHGFYNGTSVFMRVVGQEQLVCDVEIQRPKGQQYQDWRVATTLPLNGADLYGFGAYQAANYDALIDYPVEMGAFLLASFKACGVQHDIAITGLTRHEDCDIERICQDLKQICEHHIKFFGEPAPFERYLFQVMVLSEGYGGLEHRDSTSLICPRSALPRAHEKQSNEYYRDFLSLCSHEYFHVWNVKRIKPAVFLPYDLQHENYTRLLWAFEGITSYYEDLALLRCDLISLNEFFEMFAQKITQVLRAQGRKIQTVRESSFDAWTKFYKQDENVFNAIVSYYTKGALIAFCVDIKIRALSDSDKSLDDVMRLLWERYGKIDKGVPERGVEALVSELLNENVDEFFDGMLDSTEELPLFESFERIGVNLQTRPAEGLQDKGGKAGEVLEGQRASLALRIREDYKQVLVTHVINGGAAHLAGIAAGDVLVAMDRVKLAFNQFESALKRYQVGDQVEIHLFRRDELIVVNATLQAALHDTAYLECVDNTDEARLALRETWIQGSLA